jgi:putative protease
MKGIYYAASVVRVYRAALDALKAEGDGYCFRPEWLEELCKTSHRGYTTGFLFGQPREVGQEYHSAYLRSHQFVGLVEEMHGDGTATVGVRNRIKPGDTLEIMGPGMRTDTLTVTGLHDENGHPLAAANPNQRIRMAVPATAAPLDMLRREG